MEKKDFMRRAIELSKKNMDNNVGGPFGAVIVKDGKIIAEGSNNVTSSNDPTAHAEVTAIRNACKALGTFDLTGCEIYSSCEPCPMCLAAIYWAHLDKIYYSNSHKDAAEIDFDDSLIYRELRLSPEERTIKMEYIEDPKAKEIFEEWKIKSDKIPY